MRRGVLVGAVIVAVGAMLGLGVLAITHYRRLLTELRPDEVHVLSGGRIAASGGPDLAEELERTGYAGYAAEPEPAGAGAADPFADPFA